MLAFIAVGLAFTGTLSYAVQFRVLEERVRSELWQERRELQLIAEARDEEGELVHENVDELLRLVTGSAYPSDNESVLALLDGEPAYKPAEQDFDLATPPVLAAIKEAYQPGQTVITTLEVDGHEVRALIASVEVAGDPHHGVFVVANNIGVQKRAVWQSALTFTLVSLLTLIGAGMIGWVVTGRLLRPLVALREATEEITAQDLERRVPVPEGRDEIAALATNFNRMLGRIQSGFAEQRRFMSDVGHELRTPLTIVRGTLEMSDVEDPADVRESHEIAIEELDRMGRVVGDLSDLAASARPDFVTPKPLDMSDFAVSVLARIEKIADRNWVLDRSADVVAEADEQRLTQAVVQLAANAVRYSDEGSTIRLAVDRVIGREGPEIHVSVQDEGIGIPPEDQHRIFERFTRAPSAQGRGGTGLGLPIVLAIAEGHGGVVRLLSDVGKGSTFTIVFPQYQEAGSSPTPVEISGDDGGEDAQGTP